MRGNQAVEAVAGWACFHYGYKIQKVSLEKQSVVIIHWSSEERAFAVETYFSNRLCVIATQRAFREIYFFNWRKSTAVR